jgi:hypothetical protein
MASAGKVATRLEISFVDSSFETSPQQRASRIGRKPSFGRRALVWVALLVYCVAILFALDFVYTMFINREAFPRTAVERFHHGLLPNIDGYMRFGEYRYRFYTNSVGFRDASVRQVPLKSDTRRVLLMGDSFVEGMGVDFEESFAGLLYSAGMANSERIEFLDGGVASYSPVIYYQKTKYLLEAGLHFNEVLVFSDISDVQDEATAYFCIDDDARYRQYCGRPLPEFTGVTRSWFGRHFELMDRLHVMVQAKIQKSLYRKRGLIRPPEIDYRAGWTIPGYVTDELYRPLGIEGGIVRSRANMQKLADLLHTYAIPLTIVVYPWPLQLELNDRASRQVAIWEDFCRINCKTFINLFPALFAEKAAHEDWYKRLFIYGDVHFSVEGNRIIFDELARHLLPRR